ncbi:MAG: hypothetical protein MUF27_01935 [Acidobacteria bacterium]|jgi:hypothetical protein|nr:hypothetical protein [Acidobacteriota bacterium]
MSTKRTLAERAEQIRTILGDPLYRYQQTTSLDAPASDDDPDGATLGELQPSSGPSPELEAAERERRRKLAVAMRELSLREVAVVSLRFAGWSLEETAVVFQLSREVVRRTELAAAERLKRELYGEPEPPAPPPPSRPRRERPAPDPRHARMVDLWNALRNPSLLSSERDRLLAEHRALAEELRAADQAHQPLQDRRLTDG